MMTHVVGVELGGTKTVVALANRDGIILEEIRFPTVSPRETVNQVCSWIKSKITAGDAIEMGIASFGPIRVDARADDYGRFLATPKPGWSGFSLIDEIEKYFPKSRIELETDVNAALLGEMRHGGATGMRDAVYLTIGTGIGAGICCNGSLVHGTLHPEMGHIRVSRHPDDTFAGACPFHGDCWEGLASGLAMEKRWGKPAHTLPNDHAGWDWQAWYLAQGILSVVAIMSPEIVILGGGVSQFPELRDKTAHHLDVLSAGYFTFTGADLRLAGLGQRAGIIGAMELLTQAP